MPDIRACLDCTFQSTDDAPVADHKATNPSHRIVDATVGELPEA